MIQTSQGGSSFTPAVKGLLIANVGVYLLMMMGYQRVIIALFALWPPGAFMPWQLISYSFIHGDPGHLFFNMFGLWMLGTQIELYWGTRRFLVFYLGCVVGAAAAQLFVGWLSGQMYPTVGASGGVFGILLAFGMMFPDRKLLLLFFPVPIKAKYFVVGYGLLELWLGVFGMQTGVAHFAHLGGMLVGFLMIQHWRGRWPFSTPAMRDR